MKFELKKTLAEDTDSYDRDVLAKYAEYREEQGQIVRVGNLLFDIEGMMMPYACDTKLCVPAPGTRGKCSCCCIKYTPRISAAERDRIDEILPGLRTRFPRLAERIDKEDGYYYWDEDYDRYLNKVAKEQCIFLDDGKDLGFHGCLIHAYCLENDLPPHKSKPSACFMFPIFLLDLNDDEGGMLVTAHTQEVMELGEEDKSGFCAPACLQKNKIASKPLYQEMQGTLTVMFGKKCWNLLDKELRKRG